MRQVSLGDLFTEEELDRAGELHAECPAEAFATRCADEIVAPALARIDAATGQANDARYLAYMLQAAIGEMAGPGGIVHGPH